MRISSGEGSGNPNIKNLVQVQILVCIKYLKQVQVLVCIQQLLQVEVLVCTTQGE